MYRKIPVQDRICSLCHTDVENKKRFIVFRPLLQNTGKSYFDNIKDIYPAVSI